MKSDGEWGTPESNQEALNALTATLDGGPEQKRQMVEFLMDSGLWHAPDLSWDAAINRFNSNLNPARPQYFKTFEICVLMKRFDRHAFFLWLAAFLGYEVRKFATAERQQDLIAKLTGELVRTNLLVAAATSELKRLQSTGATLHVHPTMRSGEASF